jgi:hypothetical protein
LKAVAKFFMQTFLLDARAAAPEKRLHVSEEAISRKKFLPSAFSCCRPRARERGGRHSAARKLQKRGKVAEYRKPYKLTNIPMVMHRKENLG